MISTFFNRIRFISILFCLISIFFVCHAGCTTNQYHSVLSGCVEDSERELLNQLFDCFVEKITTKYNDQNIERCVRQFVSDTEEFGADDVFFTTSPKERNLIREYMNSSSFEKNWLKPDGDFVDTFNPGKLYKDCLSEQDHEMELLFDHYSYIIDPGIENLSGSFNWIFMEKKVSSATGFGVFMFVYLKGLIRFENEKMKRKQLLSLFLTEEELQQFEEKIVYRDIDNDTDFLSWMEEEDIVFKRNEEWVIAFSEKSVIGEEPELWLVDFLENRVKKLSGDKAFSLKNFNVVYDEDKEYDHYLFYFSFQYLLKSYEKILRQEGFDILVISGRYNPNYFQYYLVIPSDNSDKLYDLLYKLELEPWYFSKLRD